MAKTRTLKTVTRKFRKLEPTGIIRWTKGLQVEGTIVDIRNSTSDRFKGEGHLLDLATNTGKATYGCPTILYNYLRLIEVGEYIRITCLGKVKVPRGKAWDFDVEVEVISDTEEDDKSQDAEQ